MKTGRESFNQDIQDPVVSGRESFDLRAQRWAYKRGDGGEVVRSGTSIFDPDNILNPTVEINMYPNA
jgi:hypothetical protein